MREIRFRGWDKRLMTGGPLGGRMWYWELGKVNFDLIQAIDDSNKGHVALMQYTGLKDKNGQEIYEGDIVKIKIPKTMPNGYLNLNEYIDDIKEVKWESIIGVGFNLINVSRYEVIGNIYENPELIK